MLTFGQREPLPPAPRPQGEQDEKISIDPPRGSGLDAAWRQWIAENKLRNCTEDSMVLTMSAAGIDGDAARAAIRAMEAEPAYAAALKIRQLRDKLASVMANLQRLWEHAPLYSHVEKRTRVPRDEFIDRYVRGCRPVVLTGVTDDWPAMKRWSPQDLKARFGEHVVEIQAERSVNARYEVDKLKHRRQVKLGEFVDKVLAMGVSNDEYLTANNELLRRPEFSPLLEDIGSLPAVCDRARLAERGSFWFGPAGTVTPLHHDTLMLFHTQVVGRKRWRFVSPLQTPRLYNHFEVYSPIDLDAIDWARYPDFRDVQVLETVVEPGETLFLPLAWWHQVTSLDISLSFSYSNLDVPNEFTFQQPSIMNW